MDRQSEITICQECELYDLAAVAWLSGSAADNGFTKTTPRKLLDAKNAGCACCSIIVAALEAWQSGCLAGSDDTGITIEQVDDGLSIAVTKSGAKEEIVIYCCRGTEGYPLQTDVFSARPEVVADTRSEAAFQLVAKWLSDCLNNHAECAAPLAISPSPSDYSPLKTSPYMPRRVLDVTPDLSSGTNNHIRLVEDCGEPAPYVALSYCWGQDLENVVRTLQSNKKAHMKGIELTSLAQTIQDAVLVCRQLEIRYLWVDALCIVQDDGDDWRREAFKMCEIYENSHVTVLAHTAASCKNGFLGPQTLGQPDRQRVFWTQWPIRRSTGHGGRGSDRQTRMLLRAEKDVLERDLFRPMALDTRGWTMQESILPRRRLHFLGLEMFWECQTTQICECGEYPPSHLPQSVMNSHLNVWLDCGTAAMSEDSLLDQWMLLVQRYSRRSLTRLSDKLVAVDGLAQMITAVLKQATTAPAGCEYRDGAFLCHLPRQLLWAADDRMAIIQQEQLLNQPPATPLPLSPLASDLASVRCRRNTLLHVATWSWASIETPVRYFEISATSAKVFVTVGGFEEHPLQSAEEDSITAASTTTKAATTHRTATGLRIRGPTVSVWLRTGAVPHKPSPRDSNPTDRLKGHISVIRPADGRAWEVACDDIRTPELQRDDPAFECWLGPYLRDNYEAIRERRQRESAGTYEAAAATPPGCQFRTGDDPKWCSACRVHDDKTSNSGTETPQLCCMAILRQSRAQSQYVYFLVLQRSRKATGAWERIGIGKADLGKGDPFEKDSQIEELLLV